MSTAWTISDKKKKSFDVSNGGAPRAYQPRRPSRPTRRSRTTALQTGTSATGSRQVPGHASCRHAGAFLRPCVQPLGTRPIGKAAGQAPIKSKAKILTAILFIRSFPRSFVQLLQSGGTSFRSWLFSQSEKKIVKICACYGPQYFNLTMKEEQECRSAIEEDFLPT